MDRSVEREDGTSVTEVIGLFLSRCFHLLWHISEYFILGCNYWVVIPHNTEGKIFLACGQLTVNRKNKYEANTWEWTKGQNKL